MTEETPDLEQWLTALASGGVGETPIEHPSVEAISSYLSRKQSADDRKMLQDHLASCRECAQLLLALSGALPGVPSKYEGVGEVDAEEDWRKLQARIEAEQEPLVRDFPHATSRSPRHLREIIYALAAVLCVVALGFSIYSLRANFEPAPKAQPIFVPSATMARTADIVKKVKLGRNEDIEFVLEAPTSISFPTYRAEVRDAQGKIVLRYSTVVRQSDGFHLTVPSTDLGEGRFEIQVRGSQNGSAPIAGRYWIEIDHP